MARQWVVVLSDARPPHVYGPFDDQQTAESFARFITNEVDPADVRPLRSPPIEMLTWYNMRSLHQ